MFNLSLSSGVFPIISWKINIIRPIPKTSSDLGNILNYRPISLLSIIPKIFEFIVSSKITFELDKIISDDQHGFRPSKLTTTNFLTLQHSLTDAISTGLRVNVIYTDFAKAFDIVNHTILLLKLKYIGVIRFYRGLSPTFHSIFKLLFIKSSSLNQYQFLQVYLRART